MKFFYYLILALFSIWLLTSCSNWTEDQDRFVNTYRDIIALRMMFPDTTVANPKVEVIYKRNGYNKETFKAAFFEYSQDHDLFREMIDSARMRAKRDYMKLDTNSQPSENTIKIDKHGVE